MSRHPAVPMVISTDQEQGEVLRIGPPATVFPGNMLIVAAVGTPYDIAYFQNVSTFLTSYDFQPISLRALANAMLGHFHTTGKLPVTIRKPAPSKKVLYPFGYGLRLK